MNTEDFTTRSAEEAMTHKLLAGFPSPDDYLSTAQCVKMALRAMWANSSTIEQITAVASALGGLTGLDVGNVQIVLTRMVRAKVLRTRRSEGKKLYEMNY